jgi:serine/threonine-protein kinase
MPGGDALLVEVRRAPELESAVWEEHQAVVRAFRQALRHGDRPAIEIHAPEGSPHRKALLVELIHEEMEFRIKSGESPRLADYQARFPELAGDPATLVELVVAESALHRRTKDHVPDPDRDGTRTDPIGRIGRYELREMIGEGAFGVVYRAWDTTLHRAVALKRPRPGAIVGREAIERFLREARNAAALRHPHIVPVYDAGQVDGVAYLVSELVEGCNLADELAARRPDFRQAAEWVAALAEALEHAHSLGVVHRDVKPSNVLIDAAGRPYLTDFGLAKSDSADVTLTADGQLIGTPAYMAPEQACGDKARLGARTDVYSLGVILYELLTGTRPHQGKGPVLLNQIGQEEPRPPRRLDMAIPLDLETVCLKAMAKDPDHRYRSAGEFAADLRRHLRGEPVLARPEGRIRRIARRCRRRPMLAGMAAALVLAILSGIAGVTWQWRRAEANLARVEEQRRKAIHALSAGNRALTHLAQLANDRIVGKADRNSGALNILLFEEYRRLVGALRDDPAFLPELADASQRIARVLGESAPPGVWYEAWSESLKLFEELVRRNPAAVDHRLGLGLGHYQLGEALRRHGRRAEGEDHLRRSRQIWRESRDLLKARLEASPGDRSLARQLCECGLLLGQFGSFPDLAPEAADDLRHALAIARSLCQDEPEDQDLSYRLGAITYGLARALREDRPDEALALARSAVAHYEARLRSDPSNDLNLHDLALAIDGLAVQEDHLNQAEAALRDFRRAAELYQRLLEDRPFNVEHRDGLATVFHQIGRILVDAGRPAEAIEPFRRAIEIREALLSLTPGNIHRRTNCAGTWHRLAEAQEDLGRYADAVGSYRRCLAHRRIARSREPSVAAHRASLDDQLRDTSWLLLVLGRWDEAAELVRERRALRPGDPVVLLDAVVQHVAAFWVRHAGTRPLALIGPEGPQRIPIARRRG